ncbi:hypothetical protein HanXRQr2_Chr14g0670001 [Helianthus annuus]|uniref:Uncharacterized protein n=1 Tax=Helianthus annuus TaxID=4232 RepID=A0A251SM87_HELAN|nr:uncharacterized protein LOC110905121 [Helianthus annuus]KAF5771383.1 hypothetical protein HanXRQr2_Chr14g0670001 [Helianthus annuus]
MTLKVSQLTHTRMDLELLNYINVGMKWNVMRKGRTSMTRRPRKPGADGLLVYNIQEAPAFESKKSGGTLKIVDASSKKRRLSHQSASPPGQTRCIKGEEGVSPGPQTPSLYREDSGQRCWVSKSQKTKSKTRLRNSKMKKTKKEVLNLDDFSGIELLADVACSSFIHETADRVEDFSMSKEHTTPEVKTCSIDKNEDSVSPGSNCSVVQQTVHGVEEKKVAPSKELRLHWDLNTVMDEWVDPCDDKLIEPVKRADASISVVPVIDSCNVNSCKETYEFVEGLEVTGAKTATKMSDGESSASKSEVVDSLTHPAKCEDLYASTTSVLKEQVIAKCESGTIDGLKFDEQPVFEKVIQVGCNNKVTTDDHVSECCCSNVTQEEQGHMAEGDLEEKNQVGYDSPFEDGELREPVAKSGKETVCNKPDNIYTDNFGTIENPVTGKVNHGQTMDNPHSLSVKEVVPNNETEQGVQVDTFERLHAGEPGKDIRERKGGLHIDESTSFDECRNGEFIHRSRSSNIGDSSMRVWDLKSHRCLGRNYSRNYNSRGGGGYRTQDRRPSPSDRNNGYGSYRGPAPARGHGGDRYRYHSQEYNDLKPCYSEVKPHLSSGLNRPGTRSRSRSGSPPIAWNFQKRKSFDTSKSGEIKTGTRGGHVSPERSSKCIDDRHRFRDDQFRDTRRASITTIQQKQRYEPTGYPERLKPDDYLRFNQRSARFSHTTGYKYKDNSDDIRKHDGYHEKVNRVGRSVDDGVRRFRHAHNRE